MAEQRTSLVTPSSVALEQHPDSQCRNDTHSTAGVEYMVLQVRFPPGPLRNTHLWGRTL